MSDPGAQTPRMPPREGQMGFLSFPPLRIQGISVAGEQAVVMVPELDVSFDIGLCPRAALTASTIALTHTHMDHVAALPYWFSQRYFQKLDGGICICHPDLVDPLRKMMRSWVALERQETPHEFVALEPEAEYRLKGNLFLRAVAVSHNVPALGFVLLERRSRLRDDLVGVPQEKLRQMRLAGEEISRVVDVPLVAYTGDTEPGDFLTRPDFAGARIVVTECTFFDPDHRDRAQKGKHIHVDDLPELLRCWKAEHVVVTHISRRTQISYARERLDTMDGGAHRERLHILMDHKANRIRWERQAAAGQDPAPKNREDRLPTATEGECQ